MLKSNLFYCASPLEDRLLRQLALVCLLLPATLTIAQQAVSLPDASSSGNAWQSFDFVSDGPTGAGWSRPDEIARRYFDDPLPALFERTLMLDETVPRLATLRWIFTGPHAGVTVELTGSKLRLIERYYDSEGLSGGTYPDKTVKEVERQFVGTPRTMKVVANAHLGVEVWLNGEKLIDEAMIFDLSRHQLVMAAPRALHLELKGALLKPATMAAKVTVEPAKKEQTMLGFGGSPSIPTYARMNDAAKAEYWHYMKRYNLLLDREYPMGTELKQDLSNFESLKDATPHYYGDNFPNSEVSDFDYSKKALELGGHVIYEMWALPAWANVDYKGNAHVIDAWNKVVRKAADPEKYAAIVVAYCKEAQAKTGRPPMIVGVQNEVEQAPEVFAAMTKVLRAALDKAGFRDTQIHMADAPYLWMGSSRARELKEDATAWKDTGYIASHVYDWQEYAANPDMYDARLKEMREAMGDKPYLATEICVNDGHYQEPSYRLAFQVGQLYHKHLTELNAVALMYCWLILDVEQPTIGASRSLLVPDKSRGYMPVPSSYQLRVMGAFSRHVLEGMTRVDVTSSDKDLMVTAYSGSKGEKTIVVLNRGTMQKQVALGWTGATWAEVERTSPYDENGVYAAPADGSVTVQPGEMVTVSTIVAAR
ncbi:MAG: glycoside hydrolase family 30 beta sandwich domain-containing protein [Edaphobacter sp.]|uniref:glycoside hydrolase family 30 beta sandwich domain-containing protein n=1 Tax=Edaphobacter sp. TaxID=1934404 RepID=UPI00239C022A|nr:glycoside hydrolase family 30 beta sandwich domain-containing protein [Edaphobacter sp.]MDE1176757.1 glycoside hydrolase family 30 beta sandwich domain-containing protein [Edaphobacter sp.]